MGPYIKQVHKNHWDISTSQPSPSQPCTSSSAPSPKNPTKAAASSSSAASASTSTRPKKTSSSTPESPHTLVTQRGHQGRAHDDDGGRSKILAHIRDLSTKQHWNSSICAPAYTTHKQVFHTNAGDIVSLFALKTAAEGGTSRLSSSWSA